MLKNQALKDNIHDVKLFLFMIVLFCLVSYVFIKNGQTNDINTIVSEEITKNIILQKEIIVPIIEEVLPMIEEPIFLQKDIILPVIEEDKSFLSDKYKIVLLGTLVSSIVAIYILFYHLDIQKMCFYTSKTIKDTEESLEAIWNDPLLSPDPLLSKNIKIGENNVNLDEGSLASSISSFEQLSREIPFLVDQDSDEITTFVDQTFMPLSVLKKIGNVKLPIHANISDVYAVIKQNERISSLGLQLTPPTPGFCDIPVDNITQITQFFA